MFEESVAPPSKKNGLIRGICCEEGVVHGGVQEGVAVVVVEIVEVRRLAYGKTLKVKDFRVQMAYFFIESRFSISKLS